MIKWLKGHNRYYKFTIENGKSCREFPIFRIKPIFRWFDIYGGVYIDRENRLIYFFPIPMFGFCIGYQYKTIKKERKG